MIATAILVALGANAIGRMTLAVLAGPMRFWLPLLACTATAAAVGAIAVALAG